MSVHLDVSQLNRLAAEFAAAAARITPLNETLVLTPTAREVQADAAARAPRLTGELAGSIRVLESGVAYRTVGTDVRYAMYQEFGTSKMPPHPFMFAAGDKGGDAMAERLDDIADPFL